MNSIVCTNVYGCRVENDVFLGIVTYLDQVSLFSTTKYRVPHFFKMNVDYSSSYIMWFLLVVRWMPILHEILDPFVSNFIFICYGSFIWNCGGDPMVVQ